MKRLPAGFRFHPTDEELILHYLSKRAASCPLPVSIIAELNIYKFDPWDLPGKAAFGEKEWYFFSPRDRKYPNGARPNRAAASGYWKATGTDKTIVASSFATPRTIGVKKALVFYQGRPPKGVKTNWIMHEYRLITPTQSNQINKHSSSSSSSSSSMRLDDWVLCRIYNKPNIVHPIPISPSDQDEEEEEEQQLVSFKPQKSCSLSNLLDAMDYSLLSSILSDFPTNNNESSSSTMLDGSTTAATSGRLGEQPVSFMNGYPNTTIRSDHATTNYAFPEIQFPENRLKRQFPSHWDDEDVLCPSKKYMSCCTVVVEPAIQSDIPQNNIMNHFFDLNHQF